MSSIFSLIDFESEIKRQVGINPTQPLNSFLKKLSILSIFIQT